MKTPIGQFLADFPRRGFLAEVVTALVYDLDSLGQSFTVYDLKRLTGRKDDGTIKKIFKKLERGRRIEKLPISARGNKPIKPYRLTADAREYGYLPYAA